MLSKTIIKRFNWTNKTRLFVCCIFSEDSKMPYEEAMWYASGIIILNAINTILVNQFFIIGFHNGMKVRVAVCSLIYRKVSTIYCEFWELFIAFKILFISSVFFCELKALRLSQTALGETAPGKVVNLLSNDVNRFDWVTMFINSMWTAPLLTIIVGILLWIEIGVAGMIGIVIVFIVVPIQSE